MKTLTDYSIYCTSAQTKKALNLGAPLDKIDIEHERNYNAFVYQEWFYRIPTSEQMIGWLEEQGIYVDVCYESENRFYYVFDYDDLISEFYPTRKQATSAAIDAALEYLTNNKK